MPRRDFSSPIIECIDSSEKSIDANFLLRKGLPPHQEVSVLSSLCIQFIKQNSAVLSNFNIEVNPFFDDQKFKLKIKTGLMTGAFPVISPTSGRLDYGIVIKPRFEWAGIGLMLAKMGWRVTPTLLKMPNLPGTERKVPPWVLSTVVLSRLKALLDNLDRRFEYIHAIQSFPKGSVNWQLYSQRYFPTAQPLKIPCRYPDLRDDTTLKAIIHFTLRKQLNSLESQRALGGVVLELIGFCHTLLQKVYDVQAIKPNSQVFTTMLSKPINNEVFQKGFEAIEWTVDERGLAGLSEFEGLPWLLPMDSFFEAWIETIGYQITRQFGGVLKVGRKRETLSPIRWDKPTQGTQKYLLPDVIIEKEDSTIIFDAKYKRHWDEISEHDWIRINSETQEQHRQDILQILAYSGLNTSKRVIACLVYPCKEDTWKSLKESNRLHRHAEIGSQNRNIDLILSAVPMNGSLNEQAEEIGKYMYQTIR